MAATAALRRESEAERLYWRLMDGAAGLATDHQVACIYASWRTGAGVLPDWLGLTEDGFYGLMRCHFPRVALGPVPSLGRALAGDRLDEVADLAQLLLQGRAGISPVEPWLAEVVAAACMGNDHLWQDLGLWSRADLSDLMRRAFPGLAARNVRDMKWKRFLYRQLCEEEGVRLCRSPSCAECCDYHVCFGPED